MKTVRVADYVTAFLADRGVDTVFLLTGGGMMHLVDAVGRHPGLRYVCHHHEQAAAMAAEGYARLSGRLGVCFATSGPGATNTITGILGAWQDSAPLLVVTGQCKLSESIRGRGLFGLRQGGTFEVDILPVAASLVKSAAFLDDPKNVRRELERAYRLATTGRPGPVLLDIPVDVQGALVDPDTLLGEEPVASTDTVPAAALERTLERLATAARPVILAGHGLRVAGEGERFRKWIHRAGVPVALTPLAADLLPQDDPLYVGRVGLKGDRAGNLAVQRADVLVALGASLHPMVTGYETDRFAPDSHKTLVDIDPAVHRRQQVVLDESVVANVSDFLDRGERFTGSEIQEPWRRRCLRWKETLSVMSEPHDERPDATSYYRLIDALSVASADDAVILADAGSAYYLVGQAFRAKAKQRILLSGALGTMGWTLPAATGAAIAGGGRTVVALTGDGSLQTNVHELAVLRQERLPVKLFVANNDGYVSIRNTQNAYFHGLQVGTSPESGVWLPSLEKLAAAYELPYLRSRSPADLADTVAKAMATTGPVVCEIDVRRDLDILPRVASRRRPDGRMESDGLDEMFPRRPVED